MSRPIFIASILLAFAGFGGGGAQAQAESEWRGTIRVDYSSTGVEADMMASITLPGSAGLAVSCSSAPSQFSACGAEIWGDFERPSGRVRNVVVRIYKDGERIMSNVVRRDQISFFSDKIGFSWDMSAGAAGAYWLILAEGGELTVQFLDANGLGQPVAYAVYTFDVAALPARAIDTVRLMRASNLRPRQWAREILGGCAGEIDVGPAIVDVEVTGRQFQEEECLPW
jgi:hypothetical protein